MYKDTQKNCSLFTLSWGESMVEVGEKGLHFVHIQFWGTCFLWRIYPNKQQSLLWYSPPHPTSHNQLSFQFTCPKSGMRWGSFLNSYDTASCNKDILVRIAMCHTTLGLTQRRKGELNDASRCFSPLLVPGSRRESRFSRFRHRLNTRVHCHIQRFRHCWLHTTVQPASTGQCSALPCTKW